MKKWLPQSESTAGRDRVQKEEDHHHNSEDGCVPQRAEPLAGIQGGRDWDQ